MMKKLATISALAPFALAAMLYGGDGLSLVETSAAGEATASVEIEKQEAPWANTLTLDESCEAAAWPNIPRHCLDGSGDSGTAVRVIAFR